MSEQSPIDKEREQYFAERRKNALIVRSRPFHMLANLHLTHIPPSGNAAWREKSGKEHVVINYDHYEIELGQNFVDCIPYEIEHEVAELYATRGASSIDPHGPPHYEAIRQSIKKAVEDGMLDRYLEFKRIEMNEFARRQQALGTQRPHALEELAFYERVAKELRGS